MTRYASFNTQIEVMGKARTVYFHRGDLIYSLPDPKDSTENANHHASGKRTELCTEDLCVAQIVDCCVFECTVPEQEEHHKCGVLRVRWLYNQSGVDELYDKFKVPHVQQVNQVHKMKFEAHERVYTDHYDFIGLECFSGFADRVHAYLEIHGLEVADVERVGPVEERNAKSLKSRVWMTGFDDRNKSPLICPRASGARTMKSSPTMEPRDGRVKTLV